jgi:subtilisin family serine protease
MLVPNAVLSLSAPLRGRMYERLPSEARQWPDVSGVSTAHAEGIRGSGALVCVLDTGVDADHIQLRNKVIDFRYVPLDPRTGTMREVRGFDSDGHGTHVCGIIGGRDIGVAPDVDLMVAAVLESETLRTSLERVVVALDWVLEQFKDPANLERPVLVNMSLGFLRTSLDRTDLESPVKGLQKVLSTLLDDYHVLPLVAVGNEGMDTVRAPAYFDDTLSVGAVDYDLQVASFSGGGKSPLTGEIEPNIVGYGVSVLSSFERTIYNRSLYRKMSGTSMAAPYVTGIAALYASHDPSLQGRALWDHLVRTALPLEAPADRAGAGLARFVQEVTK